MPSWLVLLPPIIVFFLALYTQQLAFSLLIGIAAAACISTTFNPVETAKLILNYLYSQATDIDNIYTYTFLICIGSLIILLGETGGANAFAQIFTQRLKSKKAAESSTFALSCMLFLDDYLSNLTVGHIMRPLTDSFLIPRAKLAFLVHSMTGPLVILAPISSWGAMIVSQLENAGISNTVTTETKILTDPLYIYIKSIPFIFYSLFLIASVFFIIRKRISFGIMHTHEQIADYQKNLFGGKEPLSEANFSNHYHGTLSDFLVPLITLISTVIGGIAYSGGYYLFGGSATFMEAIRNNQQPFFVLATAGIITIIITTLYALLRKRILISTLPLTIQRGTLLMLSPIIMVFLASTLGLMLKNDLHTGQYLAHLLIDSIPLYLLPCMFYASSLIITMATGSAWGTIALMLPIAIPMITSLSGVSLPANPDDLYILYPVLGAIFSGAVCGDHVSPISETTIMAASSSGSYIVDHVHTQFSYALPAVLSSFISFLIAGILNHYTQSVIISIITGITLCFAILYFLNKRTQ